MPQRYQVAFDALACVRHTGWPKKTYFSRFSLTWGHTSPNLMRGYYKSGDATIIPVCNSSSCHRSAIVKQGQPDSSGQLPSLVRGSMQRGMCAVSPTVFCTACLLLAFLHAWHSRSWVSRSCSHTHTTQRDHPPAAPLPALFQMRPRLFRTQNHVKGSLRLWRSRFSSSIASIRGQPYMPKRLTSPD